MCVPKFIATAHFQSMKMILKFRETHISNLEKAKHSNPAPASAQDTIVVSLFTAHYNCILNSLHDILFSLFFVKR